MANSPKKAGANKSGQKKKSGGSYVVKGVTGALGIIGRIFAIVFLILVITGCIVATVITLYVMQFINSDPGVDLRSLELSSTTILYASDSQTGEITELRRLHDTENRIWVDIEDIPQYVQDVTIAGEDKRFEEHMGVDWGRTVFAFVNEFLHMSGNRQGGSTITQQLIKNITDDNAGTYERKIREIFRALNLEKLYTKEDILEAYLNTIPFGHGAYGIQAAANVYFGKEVGELTIPEAASIIATTKNPSHLDPINNVEDNKERRDYILEEMNKMGKISDPDLKKYLAAPVVTKASEITEEVDEEEDSVMSYFEDAVYEEVLRDLMEEYNYNRHYASNRILNGGYRIYTTVDTDVQDVLESYYENIEKMPKVNNPVYPQGACVVTDIHGKILGMVGGTGEKEASRILNHATQTPQQPGSSIKPLTVYGQGIQNNVITWSTLIDDNPVDTRPDGTGWPVNFNGIYQGMMPVCRAIQISTNTVAVRLSERIGPKNLAGFLKDNFNPDYLITTGPNSDADRAPMALGAMGEGFTPVELVGMFQVFSNGGTYVKPYTYTKVLDAEGKVILEKNTTPKRVFDPESAAVMNRLLNSVTTVGTASSVRFSDQPIGGKTGTTSNDLDHWFVGFSPYYVCGIWLGYDEIEPISYYPNTYPPLPLFRNIMGELHQNLPIKDFDGLENCVQKVYCTQSGGLASPACKETAVGYYKPSYLPSVCTEHLGGGDEDEESSGSSSSGPVEVPVNPPSSAPSDDDGPTQIEIPSRDDDD